MRLSSKILITMFESKVRRVPTEFSTYTKQYQLSCQQTLNNANWGLNRHLTRKHVSPSASSLSRLSGIYIVQAASYAPQLASPLQIIFHTLTSRKLVASYPAASVNRPHLTSWPEDKTALFCATKNPHSKLSLKLFFSEWCYFHVVLKV